MKISVKFIISAIVGLFMAGITHARPLVYNVNFRAAHHGGGGTDRIAGRGILAFDAAFNNEGFIVDTGVAWVVIGYRVISATADGTIEVKRVVQAIDVSDEFHIGYAEGARNGFMGMKLVHDLFGPVRNRATDLEINDELLRIHIAPALAGANRFFDVANDIPGETDAVHNLDIADIAPVFNVVGNSAVNARFARRLTVIANNVDLTVGDLASDNFVRFVERGFEVSEDSDIPGDNDDPDDGSGGEGAADQPSLD